MYTIITQSFAKKIIKKLKKSKGARKNAKQLAIYIKKNYNYEVKILYDIVEKKVLMLGADEIKDRLDKEITMADAWFQGIFMGKYDHDVSDPKYSYDETRAKAISLAVAGCLTCKEVVNTMKEEGFRSDYINPTIIAMTIHVWTEKDKDRILGIYNKAPHVFEAAGQSIEDVERWMDSKFKAQ